MEEGGREEGDKEEGDKEGASGFTQHKTYLSFFSPVNPHSAGFFEFLPPAIKRNN